MRLPAILRNLLLLSTVLFQLGCDKWPPMEKEAREQFEKGRSAMEALESLLISSKLGAVTRYPSLVEGQILIDDEMHYEEIEDFDVWLPLFEDAAVHRVSRNEDAFFFDFLGEFATDDSYGTLTFIHYADTDSSYKLCKPKFENLDCGMCFVELDSDWWIKYKWFPHEVLPKELDEQLYEGTLDEEKHQEMFDAALEQCNYEGFSTIGYDIGLSSTK